MRNPGSLQESAHGERLGGPSGRVGGTRRASYNSRLGNQTRDRHSITRTVIVKMPHPDREPPKEPGDASTPAAEEATGGAAVSPKSSDPAVSSAARSSDEGSLADRSGAADASEPAENGAGDRAAGTAEERSRNAFLGRSGQLAVMSELLHRKINVAIPEVDVGDDIFVVRGNDEAVTRVQVKSATAQMQQNSYVARFTVPLDQLAVPGDSPPLVYIFAVRFRDRWSDFIIVRRSALFARFVEGGGKRVISRDGKTDVAFRVKFTESTTHSGSINIQRHRNAWNPWPPSQFENEEIPQPIEDEILPTKPAAD